MCLVDIVIASWSHPGTFVSKAWRYLAIVTSSQNKQGDASVDKSSLFHLKDVCMSSTDVCSDVMMVFHI